MSLIGIINIIMQILAFIAGLFNPKTGLRYTSYVTDFDCGAVEWKSAPVVSGGEFSGTAQVACTFEGHGGGGVLALREHLMQQLPSDSEFRGNAKVGFMADMPSVIYAMELPMGEGVTAHGNTTIATNGFTGLVDVFESKSFSGGGNAAYLKSVVSKYEVSLIESGVYELKTSQELRVRKPALMSASQFKTSLKDQAEETLMDRAVNAVQEMASHL